MCTNKSYLNQLEPDFLVQVFLNHPPDNFNCWLEQSLIPTFAIDFNILTTVDNDIQKKIKKLPLFNYWQKWLSFHSCFIGTTVSEYALLPKSISPEQLVKQINTNLLPNHSLTIVKDLPYNSPLLSEQENQFSDTLLQQLKQSGFITILGQALACVAINFTSINDYLACFSKNRRKDFRRKLKKRAELTIKIINCGDNYFSDLKILEQFYQLYLNTYQQSEIHFDLLSRDFFYALLQDKNSHGLVFTYANDQELIGFNLCYTQHDKLIDKYIGFNYPLAQQYNLYYISWFENLQYAIDHQLSYYVAGWTDPEIKAYLGAQFTFTQHAVYIRNPVLRLLLKSISHIFQNDKQWQATKQNLE